MERHWPDREVGAAELFDELGIIDIGRTADFYRRRKLEERGTLNGRLHRERLRAASLSTPISHRIGMQHIRLHSSDSED